MASLIDPGVPPAARPLQGHTDSLLRERLAIACAQGDGLNGAHCIHELWMRGEMGLNVERYLAALWDAAGATIPDWLPMRYIERLAEVYAITARFAARRRGRMHVYLVLLDYRDSRDDPFGFYVGMSRYAPSVRFDQHKAGIRAAGSVTRRGLEVLTGPTRHLQSIARADALLVEERLAEAMTAAGLFVQGGH